MDVLPTQYLNEIYKFKYILRIEDKILEILSNLFEEEFKEAVKRIIEKESNKIIKFEITDCIEFYYTKLNIQITLTTLADYI